MIVTVNGLFLGHEDRLNDKNQHITYAKVLLDDDTVISVKDKVCDGIKRFDKVSFPVKLNVFNDKLYFSRP